MKAFNADRSLRLTRMDVGLIIAIFIANLPSFSLWYYSWKYFTIELMQPQMVIMLTINSLMWLFVISLIFIYLKQFGVLDEFIQSWKKQYLLITFIIVALFSVFWSISPLISGNKILILTGSSILGSFIGRNLKISKWLDLLFWFGLGLIIFNIAFALLLPGVGTMTDDPYTGVWRGIFWHKNHLGSIFALVNAVFLVRAATGLKINRVQALLDIVLYFLSLMVVYFAESAAGYILTFLLHGMIGIILLWIKVHSSMRRVHYFFIIGISIILMVLAANNLDFVFGLVNRSSSLTGRIPMWRFLFQHVISQSPWVGFGYGAVWAISLFRSGIANAVGWEYPVLLGDNGLIDILLSVGILGFIPFTGVFILAWIRSIKIGFERKQLIDFFPLVFMVFATFANISFSLFLETESFIWLLMVAVLFIPSSSVGNAEGSIHEPGKV